jgi:hypothetical protein
MPVALAFAQQHANALLRNSLIVAANLRFAVKIQDIGKPEARRHEIRRKAPCER